MMLAHATTVEITGLGVLIRGPSGSGKSDLALRLMDGGAALVADDQTRLSLEDGTIVARAPETIRGLLEVRGVGVLRVPHRVSAPLALVVDLVAEDRVERLPEPAFAELLGRSLPRLELYPFHASAAAKVRLAVTSTNRDIMPP